MTPQGFDRGYFDRAYRSYAAQNPPHKLAHYLAVMRRHLPVDGSTSVLDVGCGLGAFAGYLDRETNWGITAVDVDSEVIAHDRQRFPGVDFRVGGAGDLGLPNATFDAVTAMDVIEHVPDRDAVLASVESVLRPGGFLFFVVPVYDGASGPIIRRLDHDETHVHRVGRQDWLSWVANRLDVVEWHGIVRYLLPAGLYLHVPTRRLRRHTPAVLVVAQKR